MSDSSKTTKQHVIQGKALECNHCGSSQFSHRKSQLNTSAMSFFNLDWLNASADVYACRECGFLHWFLRKP